MRTLEISAVPGGVGLALPLQVSVVRGTRPGPRVFLTGGIHGDELTGIEIVREISSRVSPVGLAGDLICIPVVNRSGFLQQSRYLADGTDLNRTFPGCADGSPASSLAEWLMREIVGQCDYGLDFHTAARGRSNCPHVRADMGDPGARRLAKAFGTRIVLHRRGNRRSLRRVATEAGVPTIVWEAGATGRLERAVVLLALQGVQNVLVDLGMLEGRRWSPQYQVVVRRSVWVRAHTAGLVELNVRPGDLVYAGQLLGNEIPPATRRRRRILSPSTGFVIGASLGPLCEPGAPLCHIVKLARTLATVERHLRRRARRRATRAGARPRASA